MENPKEVVRQHLKVLLLHLAAKSDNPSGDLQELLEDVIDELHSEVESRLERRPSLKLVQPGSRQ